MLEDVDATLETLVKREFSQTIPSSDTEVFFSFDTPYQGAIKQKPALNFFLYDVRENLELRNVAGEWERKSDGTATKKRPPTRVDCSYLVTAWPQNEDDVQTEHQLLGEVMRVMLRYHRIPLAYLQDSLAGQDIPVKLTSLRPNQLNSFGEYWQAMGGKEGTKPKVALHCTVTIAIPAETEEPVVSLVGLQQNGGL